ncbi:hypothetical protein BN1051_01230 [Arthrobacter saudimassiliensis]|uniref:Uncharacterized protein n=1 Tax=Arthrobacter saudimassiliensis TaxID=1461584 RepID=A0A078MNQ6_9MICC|nr:hypothetical protein BN1051_01230 [Arthrobacter saudimassiliensis]
MKNNRWLSVLMPYAWPRLLLVALGVVVLIAGVSVSLGGLPPAEFFLLLAGGLAGGTAVIAGLPASKGVLVLALLVIAEYILLLQMPEPWSALAAMVIPANAGGSLLGQVVQEGLRLRAHKVVTNTWLVNGHEETTTSVAKASALDGLDGWDSAASGRFTVQYNNALFEAVGNPGAGYIIHCTSDYSDDDSWRILGTDVDKAETVIRIPTGRAYAPTGVVHDQKSAQQALRGFFHYRGPDPALPWSDGPDVLDLRFG